LVDFLVWFKYWDGSNIIAISFDIVFKSTAMDILKMGIYGICGKDTHALPAYVSSTPALHMVATLYLLDPYLTRRTLLDSTRRRPCFVHSVVCSFVVQLSLCTCHAVMSLFVANRANSRKTRRALECRVHIAAVDLVAIWGGAIPEFLWVTIKVRSKGDGNQLIELLR